MTRPLNLNSYLYFETVVRLGTVTRAAEAMSVSPSAISQQIKSMEQQLGVKLFRRNGRVLTLTLEGEQLFNMSSNALGMLRAAGQHFEQGKNRLTLNLRVTPSFGVRWLGPRLADFTKTHADWNIRVDAAPDPTNFDHEAIDLEIRYGHKARGDIFSQPIFQDRIMPMCSPKYRNTLIDDHGDNADAILAKAMIIGTPHTLCQWDQWCAQVGIETAPSATPLLIDRSAMALQMAVDGAGIVLDNAALALPELQTGALVPLFPGVPVLTFDAYWLVCPHRNLNRKTVKEFLGWFNSHIRGFERDMAAAFELYELEQRPITIGNPVG